MRVPIATQTSRGSPGGPELSITLSFAPAAEGSAAAESGTAAADGRPGHDPGCSPPSEGPLRLEVTVEGLPLGQVRLSRPPSFPAPSPHALAPGIPSGFSPDSSPGGAPGPLSRTAGSAPGRAGDPARPGHPSPLRTALSDRATEAERSRALRLLGLRGDERLRVAAVLAPEAAALPRALREIALALGDAPSAGGRAAPRGVLWSTGGAILLPGSLGRPAEGSAPPAGAAVGLGPAGPAAALADSWAQARRAARFADLGPTWPRWADAAELGALALLADIPAGAALAHPDVSAVARLAGGPGGAQSLGTLDAVCRSRSLRDAAELLHLHHSSVAQRVTRIERALGIALSEPHGRQRAQTALVLWRLNTPLNDPSSTPPNLS
ncbi:helix-turn-helix domain-containing protein [Streptomyces sp. NPDC020141]|uniref:helix-turn-helix domain-containing protein n=1 Tax=Streptomyces sp. NPDC020141 TaxID=3365065 RepID=UPI0037920B1D